jgi:hypothetical protein
LFSPLFLVASATATYDKKIEQSPNSKWATNKALRQTGQQKKAKLEKVGIAMANS